MALATATIIGLTTSAIGAGMSFKQAAEAKTAAQTAETDAKNLMDEAKKNIEKDYMEELTVPLDAFEAASKENVALQNQSIQAIREGDQRGSYGAVTQLGQDSAEQRRIAMGQELTDLEKLKIQSKENIRDEVAAMDVAGAADANLRARDAQQSRTAAMTNAVSALGQGANAYAEGQDLYGTGKDKMIDMGENPYGLGVNSLEGLQPPSLVNNPYYSASVDKRLRTPYSVGLERRGLHY